MIVEYLSIGVISFEMEYDFVSWRNDDCVMLSGVSLGFVKRRIDIGVVGSDVEWFVDNLEYVVVLI